MYIPQRVGEEVHQSCQMLFLDLECLIAEHVLHFLKLAFPQLGIKSSEDKPAIVEMFIDAILPGTDIRRTAVDMLTSVLDMSSMGVAFYSFTLHLDGFGLYHTLKITIQF